MTPNETPLPVVAFLAVCTLALGIVILAMALFVGIEIMNRLDNRKERKLLAERILRHKEFDDFWKE